MLRLALLKEIKTNVIEGFNTSKKYISASLKPVQNLLEIN